METENPQDHAEHDPALCDYARIWLTQQYVANAHAKYVDKLEDIQIIAIGMKSCVYSSNPLLADLYASYGITLTQLYEFSEYLRNYLLNERGYYKNIAMNLPPDPTKVNLN